MIACRNQFLRVNVGISCYYTTGGAWDFMKDMIIRDIYIPINDFVKHN